MIEIECYCLGKSPTKLNLQTQTRQWLKLNVIAWESHQQSSTFKHKQDNDWNWMLLLGKITNKACEWIGSPTVSSFHYLILVIVVFFLMYHLIKWDKLLYRIYTMFLCSCLNGKPEQMHNVYTLQYMKKGDGINLFLFYFLQKGITLLI